MKKLIPYLLLSATTLHTFLGISPVIAMGCDLHSDKTEVVCKEEDTDCEKETSAYKIN